MGAEIDTRSLREQVYDHLKALLIQGQLIPGRFLDLNAISRQIGISKTPLRDALLHLETQGFIEIIPRRGVIVAPLTIAKIRNLYEIIGALEATALLSVKQHLDSVRISRMDRYNRGMEEALFEDDFDLYYSRNLEFHNVFLTLSNNQDLIAQVNILKERLYDFPRNPGYVKEWELASVKEHAEIVRLLAGDSFQQAAAYLRDVHWSFSVQEPFIREYYFANRNNLETGLEA
jgi:DNA-binding GntR family transcriptional regulator